MSKFEVDVSCFSDSHPPVEPRAVQSIGKGTPEGKCIGAASLVGLIYHSSIRALRSPHCIFAVLTASGAYDRVPGFERVDRQSPGYG
jgi:hypothetical protein